MAIKLIPVKCPECGASLNAEEGRQQMFCQYCGAKIILSNDNEYIIRTIDEAGIKKAEVDRSIQMKKLELAEKERQFQKTFTTIALAIALVMFVFSIIWLGFL